jgi:glycine cleavage system H protein
MAEVESTKSVSTIYAPLSGTVASVNDLLAVEPQHINSDPYGKGWLCTLDLDDPASVTDLLSATDYRQLTDGPNQ